MRLTVGVRSVLRCESISQRNTLRTPILRHILSQRTLTQHNMLPQHYNNTRNYLMSVFKMTLARNNVAP